MLRQVGSRRKGPHCFIVLGCNHNRLKSITAPLKLTFSGGWKAFTANSVRPCVVQIQARKVSHPIA
jgi:hypothetical protein